MNKNIDEYSEIRAHGKLVKKLSKVVILDSFIILIFAIASLYLLFIQQNLLAKFSAGISFGITVSNICILVKMNKLRKRMEIVYEMQKNSSRAQF